MAGKRRIDRILDERYLDDLQQRTTDEIRRMRDECEEEESGVSYARRVLQGRLDILRAEALRRREEGNAAAGPILEALPGILSDEGHTTSPTEARVSRFLVPPAVKHHRRAIDHVADDQALTDVRTRPDEELQQMAAQLSGIEGDLSRTRRTLLDRIDRLQEELIRRYKTGDADVTQILAPRG